MNVVESKVKKRVWGRPGFWTRNIFYYIKKTRNSSMLFANL